MKKCVFILFCSFLWSAVTVAENTIDIMGVPKTIDTLVYRSVGPGVTYTKFRLPQYPIDGYMLTIDLNDSCNAIETFQAGDVTAKTENMTGAYHRLSTPGHTVLGGVNANFWIVPSQGYPAALTGVPHSGSIRNGEIVTDPNGWNRGRGETPEELLQDIGFAVIDEAKKARIEDMKFDGKVIAGEGEEFPITQVNRMREANELVFYNTYVGEKTKTEDDGTEVFIRPVDGNSWGVNRNVECEVIRIVKDKGSNPVGAGESVLSGSGDAKTFLEKLSVGQRITVNMGVYTLIGNERPLIRHMVTGNALVMKDGLLTNRNYNEDYNSQLYPRTGIGCSDDGKTVFLIVIDGKAAHSVGVSTETMCEILKAAGARHATSMDGGGSAQMMLRGEIVNMPADGKERAVANGWFVYSTAPEDEEITRIEFTDYKVRIPVYSTYAPVFLGYNRYGVLCNESQDGVVLSCDPSLGYIDEEGKFVASSNPGKGILTARYGKAEVSKEIELVAADLQVRLDSVWIDNRFLYPIEVRSLVDGKYMDIPSSVLEWTVEDPSVCQVRDGVLSGIANGQTRVFGSKDNFSDTLKVRVQIPESHEIVGGRFDDPSKWTLKASSNLKNTVLSAADYPAEWPWGMCLRYTYGSGRFPSARLTGRIPFYSLPDTVKLVLNTGEAVLDELIVGLKTGSGEAFTTPAFKNIPPATDYAVTFALADVLPAAGDIAVYPVSLEYILMYLNSSAHTAGQEYKISLREIRLCYGEIESGIEEVNSLPALRVYPNPVNDGIVRIYSGSQKQKAVKTEFYDLAGCLLRSCEAEVLPSGMAEVSVGSLPAGTYLLKIIYEGHIDTVKLMIR